MTNIITLSQNTNTHIGVGATEVFSTRIRAKAMSLSVSTNRLISGVIASATLPLLKALRSRCVLNSRLCVCAVAVADKTHTRPSMRATAPVNNPSRLHIHPSMRTSIHPSIHHSGYFALYAALTFGSMVYLYLFFPETKGRTLEQVEVRAWIWSVVSLLWLASTSADLSNLSSSRSHSLSPNIPRYQHHFEEIVASKERREAARHAAADAAAAEDGATTMNGSSHKGSDADLTEK